MKRIILISVLLVLLASKGLSRNGFAIVIDQKSYNEAQNEVKAYADCIKKLHNLKVYTVIDKWHVPDSIRAILKTMHQQKKEPVIGTVLIGDIPIAMIRDAQHMTSAFKMDQRANRKRSSVPSDRYYDDFGLKFTSLGHDNDAPYYYYSLTPDSRQHLEPSIYSGRIRPTDVNGSSRYEKLRNYLKKVVNEKWKRRSLQQMFFFGGHGYISESKVARIDEKAAFYEHFPQLKQRTNTIGFLNHDDETQIKETYMNEMMRTDLDLAVLHHHGAPHTEYLNNIPKPNTAAKAKEFIQKYARQHIYAAKQKGRNYDSLRTVIEKRFDLPTTWLSNAVDDQIAAKDSAADAALDLHLEDFAQYGYKPNTPVVLLDACFNGSFHLDNCIANEYIFQPGSTVACVANSVNVLQDKWSDRFIGLIAEGGCVGDIVRYSTYLESHVIGDPTFRFMPERTNEDLDDIINSNKVSDLRRLLKNGTPDGQSLAIEHLFRLKEISSSELRRIYEKSPYGIVRLQALTLLSQMKDDNFISVLQMASQDAYEMVQRRAAILIGKSGDDRLIPSLMKLVITNNLSARVAYDTKTALQVFPTDKLLAEFKKQFDAPSVQCVNKEKVRQLIEATLKRHSTRWIADTKAIMSDTLTTKKRIGLIRQTRNYMIHEFMPELMSYAETSSEPAVQVALLETLGWHTYSYQAKRLAERCLNMSKNMKYTKEVRDEALKTYRRLNFD